MTRREVQVTAVRRSGNYAAQGVPHVIVSGDVEASGPGIEITLSALAKGDLPQIGDRLIVTAERSERQAS